MAFLILVGCFFVHTIANIANDLFDYILDVDVEGSIGGTGIIQSGAIPPRSITFAIGILLLAACSIAYYILITTELWWMLGFLVFAVFSALFYVAPPIRYGHRGWGEVFVALNMGFLMTCGTQIVLSRQFLISSLPFGLLVGIMVAGILYYQSLPEIETDKSAGKYTLAVKLGKERAKLVFDIWWPITWLLMANLWACHMASAWIFVGFASIPLYIIASRRIHKASAPQEWLELDNSGHLVRKLYLINGLATIIGAFTL